MEIKDFIDNIQYGNHYVYVIDSKGKQIRKHKHSGNIDIYFISADLVS